MTQFLHPAVGRHTYTPAVIHFLIVDDQPDVRLGLAFLLQGKNSRIGEVADVDAALDYIRQHRVDLILCDLYLPGKSGLELIKAVRQMALPRPAIVLISGGFGQDETVEEAARLAADAYLTKPISRDRLLDTCRRLLGAERAKTIDM